MHIDRTDREAGTQRERERETADSWLAKQTDRQQTSPHLHIFPNLTSYIFTSWHLLIFTSSHLHIHLHIFSFSHFSSSHLLIFTPSKISSHLHIFSSSHPHISHLLIFTLHIFTPSHIHICSSSHLLILTLSSSHLGFRELVAANPVKHDLALHQTPPRPPAPNLPEPSPEPSLEPCRTSRNQSEPLESSTDPTTGGGPEFGPFSPEKRKKRTPATKPRRRSAEPSPEPKWTPGIIHRYYDPRGSGIWTFQPRKAQKADPRNKASQTFCGTFSGTKVNPWNHPQILRPAGVRNLDLSAPKSSKSGPPQQSLPDVLRNLLRNQSEPLESSTEECIWEKAICPSARRMTSEKRIKLEFNSSDTCPVGWKLEKN